MNVPYLIASISGNAAQSELDYVWSQARPEAKIIIIFQIWAAGCWKHSSHFDFLKSEASRGGSGDGSVRDFKLTPLGELAHVLLNSNEFIYIN